MSPITTSPGPPDCGLLALGDRQQLYWEEWGTPGGVPALYLHGGPGGTLGASGYRNRFDLGRTRVIGFEQRGCGRSLPHVADPGVSMATQTMATLIADIETLREHLGVDAWLLNGVSWGSTLALAYAQAHPERVLGIVLFAVTTTSRAEVDWVTECVGMVFPEAWDRLATFAEQSWIGYRRGNGRLVEAFSQLLNSPDLTLRDAASREWALWEDTHISLASGEVRRDPRWRDDAFRLAFARLVTHYWAHDGFCDPPILERMERLAGIPGVLIHGRWDISGPLVTAWQVHQHWPGSRLIVVEGDGHGGTGMVEAWSQANDELVSHCASARAPRA